MQERVAARAVPQLRASRRALASYLLIGLVALLPRAIALGLFITDDEANFWLSRSNIFLQAIQSGDYAATAITAHPGVTTMWLGAAGIVLRHALQGWGILHSEAFPVLLALMRLPVVLTHVAAILVGYRLLRVMLPARIAGLAALLWAADPFVIGYSKLLHTDALAGSFMSVSILAACCYWNHQRHKAWLIGSGISAGLAFLSKSPALALLPAVGLVALLAAISETRRPADRRNGRGRRSSLSGELHGRWPAVAPLVAWGAIACATVFALWPALWVSPLQAYQQLRIGVEIEGAQPHQLGNFFLGRADDAPGLLYYPVALVMRTTPWTLIGLLVLPLAWRLSWPENQRRDLAGLAGFAVLFVIAMSVFPKKFDRYIVPAFPALDILAAVGLSGLIDFGVRPRHGQLARSKLGAGLAAAIALLALVNLAWWQPYSIVAFNQLLGGTRAGAQTFTVGWGEGLEQVADWLNKQPDITGVRTIALRVTSLNPYLRDGAQADFPANDQLRERSGYVVVYLPQVQAGHAEGVFAQFYGRQAPLHTVRIQGVDFAWIYQAPPPVAQLRGADFGPSIRLRGFDRPRTATRGQPLQFTLVWTALAAPPQDYWLFAHLIGPDGQRYAQLDLPYPTSQWQPGRFATSELPIGLPANAPPGAYRVLIGLYDQATGQRLPLATTTEGGQAAEEPDAFVLQQFDVQ